MKRKAIILFTLILIVMVNVCGCGKKQKTNVLTNDVKKEITMQENEIKKFIKDGTNFLNAGKYDEAKSSFEKAISMDKANRGAYIQIKNKYMEKQRLDDAYYFIKLAISNNVDTGNMENLLNDIKSKFEVTKLYANVYKNNQYKLPDKIKVKINNEYKEVDVIWNNNNVDTSKVGTTNYKGKIEKYDRYAELNFSVIEPKKEKKINKVNKVNKEKKIMKLKKIGFIRGVYEQNGKKYLKIDDVEFFKNKDANDYTAEREAKKDGRKELFGDGRVLDSYYIRNKDRSLETYKISSDADIYICKHRLRDFNGNSTILEKTSYEKFKTLDFNYGSILCYIYLEDDVVVKIEEQYRP